MRILLVAHGSPLEKMGGAGLLVQQLAQELHKRGHQVHVLVPKPNQLQAKLLTEEKKWGTLHQIEARYFQWRDSWDNQESQQILRHWLNKLKPDVCHIHHLSGIPLNFHQLLPPKTKLIITLHDYAIPCARGQLYHREHRTCSTNHINNCYLCLKPFRASRGSIIQRLQVAEELLLSADTLLSPSQDLANRIQRFYPSCRVQLIALPLFEPPTKTQAVKDTDFIFVGSIIPPKGLDLLLKAILRFPPAQAPSLKIIGFSAKYPSWKNYHQYCQNLASLSPSIQWLGEQEYAKTIREMSTARCLVLPSLWPENSPLTIREATSLGLQVVCSAWGGAAELLSSSQFVLQKPSVFQLYLLLKQARNQPEAKPKSWPSTKTYCDDIINIYN